MNPYRVLLKPIMTEKGIGYKERENVYLFRVDMKATKEDIKRSVEKLFEVDVLDVRTVILRGKPRRRGMGPIGTTPTFKKAYVKLKKGDTIPIFEGL